MSIGSTMMEQPIQIFPQWILVWVKQDDGRLSHSNGSTLFSLPVWLTVVIVFALTILYLLKSNVRVFEIINPLYRSYDFSVFIDKGTLWLIPASWVLTYITNAIGFSWPMFGLVLIYSVSINWTEIVALVKSRKQSLTNV